MKMELHTEAIICCSLIQFCPLSYIIQTLFCRVMCETVQELRVDQLLFTAQNCAG